jgi:SAM-dependent methyltransferase
MKVRDSGMPDEATWERFFDSHRILIHLDGIRPAEDVVDFGCGYGTFTVAAAQMTSGTVHAIDIEAQMLRATQARAAMLGLGNVRALQRDFVAEGTGLPDASVGYAMLFNILHGPNPVALLQEAFRVLRAGGRVGAIHWIHDAGTPRGPDLSIRPRPEQCQEWMLDAGFELKRPLVALAPYHFGVVGLKPAAGGP